MIVYLRFALGLWYVMVGRPNILMMMCSGDEDEWIIIRT